MRSAPGRQAAASGPGTVADARAAGVPHGEAQGGVSRSGPGAVARLTPRPPTKFTAQWVPLDELAGLPQSDIVDVALRVLGPAGAYLRE